LIGTGVTGVDTPPAGDDGDGDGTPPAGDDPGGFGRAFAAGRCGDGAGRTGDVRPVPGFGFVNMGLSAAGGPGDGAREGTSSGLSAVGVRFGESGFSAPEPGGLGRSAGRTAGGFGTDAVAGAGLAPPGAPFPDCAPEGFASDGLAPDTLGSVAVPLGDDDAAAGASPSWGVTDGEVTVPAADERDEDDAAAGSSLLSFGTRCTPDADGNVCDSGDLAHALRPYSVAQPTPWRCP
jgi:hypothetical protein